MQMLSSRSFAAASVLAVIASLPAPARAEFRGIELKIVGMD
jgi:hypothetical protein